ncbi:hypothetical protein [Rugosimonospora acidiphila]
MTGVAAVVLNVTVVSPTVASYLTVWPTGGARPTVSNIDFAAGWTGANSTTVPLGSGGQVDIYNLTGQVQVLADVVGFYASDASATSTLGDGGDMVPVAPSRLGDTREAGDGGGPFDSGEMQYVIVDFGPDLNPYVQAVAVNLTAVNPTGSGFMTAWNSIGDAPGTSTLDYATGKTVSNMTIVPTTLCTPSTKPCAMFPEYVGLPMFAIYNQGATTDAFTDIFAVYTDTAIAAGLRFQPMNPVRIIDTRTSQGGHGALGAGVTAAFTPPTSVRGSNTFALAANVTAVSPTVDTYLTAWATGDQQPVVSNMDPAKGTTVANTADIPLGNNAAFNLYNHGGTINVLVDVQGRFDLPTTAAANTRVAIPAVKASKSPVAIAGSRMFRTHG